MIGVAYPLSESISNLFYLANFWNPQNNTDPTLNRLKAIGWHRWGYSQHACTQSNACTQLIYTAKIAIIHHTKTVFPFRTSLHGMHSFTMKKNCVNDIWILDIISTINLIVNKCIHVYIDDLYAEQRQTWNQIKFDRVNTRIVEIFSDDFFWVTLQLLCPQMHICVAHLTHGPFYYPPMPTLGPT